jgi:hypothetical protein
LPSVLGDEDTAMNVTKLSQRLILVGGRHLVTSDGKKQGRARVMGGMASLRGKI